MIFAFAYIFSFQKCITFKNTATFTQIFASSRTDHTLIETPTRILPTRCPPIVTASVTSKV